MKFVPSRPVTIQSSRQDQRWFPALYLHTDGSLLLYVQCGFDAEYAPFSRWRSTDGGRSWHAEETNVPRCQIVHSFADGTLLEFDLQGYFDPNSASTFVNYAAWSDPSRPHSRAGGYNAFDPGDDSRGEVWLGQPHGEKGPLRTTMRIDAPSVGPQKMSGPHGYPTYPWWSLINHLHPVDVRGEDVLVGGPILCDIVEQPDRLLAIGYAMPRGESGLASYCVFIYESLDRGRNWREIGTVARGSQGTIEGYNEATLTQLKDGRLYSVLRSGTFFCHAWSQDNGLSWTEPVRLRTSDTGMEPQMAWPRVATLEDGTLVLAYGRPGKNLLFDPTGTGTAWQGHIDLQQVELETQEYMGVPSAQQLRGPTELCVRYWDSGDYLSVVPIGPREMLVTYDVQSFVENWNAIPFSGVRMVTVRLED